MNQKKNKGLKIAIITTLIIIFILIGILGFLYFATDILKSNKELFFKYTSKLLQPEKGFISKEIIQYTEKKKSNPYEDNGNIDFEVSLPDVGQNQDLINDFNITYNGKVNNQNQKNEQNISLNYSDNVNFPLSYRKVEDIKGIQTDYVGSKYIANKDGEEEKGYGLELKGLENLNKLNEMKINYENLNKIKITYFDNIINKVQVDKFSKIEENDKIGYKLSLTGEELKNFLIQMLETLKNDENTIDILNKILNLEQSASKFNTTNINDMIESLEKSELSAIEMTVYGKNNKVLGILIKTENIQINLDKEESNNEQTYSVKFVEMEDSEEIMNINFIAKYTGLNSDNVVENYEISLASNYENSNEETTETQSLEYKYIINNTTKFVSNVDIEDFTEQNAIVLSKQDEEYVNNLMNAIKERIILVNKAQMEELGATENQNPIMYLTPITVLETVIFNQAASGISEVQATEFNNKFQLYKGTNQKGVTVKGLLSTIALNNGYEKANSNSNSGMSDFVGNNNPKITEIHFDGEEYEVTEQNITLIKSMIETETSYRVEFELDSNTGLIYRVVINKK